jgi:hypothetical protein
MSLTAHQEQELHKAAGWLPPARRANFIRSVENHLRDRPFISGGDLRHAIKRVLGAYGVSAPDTKENSHETL